MKLIDADELMKYIADWQYQESPSHVHLKDREDAVKAFAIYDVLEECYNTVKDMPTIDAVPVIRCKDCKHFELNHFENVNGIPLIVAHEICMRWADGVQSSQEGYCFLGEKKEK